jgi:hypothetical protein
MGTNQIRIPHNDPVIIILLSALKAHKINVTPNYIDYVTKYKSYNNVYIYEMICKKY